MSKSKAALIAPEKPPKFVPDLPDKELKIRAVFGYGGDIRGNLAYNNDNELVYMTAGTGVINDGKGNQKFHYGHTNDISAMCMEPSRRWVASGDMTNPGKSPVIRIWNPITGKPIINIEGKDKPIKEGHLLDKQIVDISFNKNGNLLAAIGDDSNHEITILETKTEWTTFERITNRITVANKINWVEFYDDNIVYFGGDKCILKFNIETNDYKKVLFGDFNMENTLCAIRYNNYLVVGTSSGKLYIVDDNKIIKSIDGHTKNTNCFCIFKDKLLSGGADKLIKIYSNDLSKILYTIDPSILLPRISNVHDVVMGSITALACNDNNISIGTLKCNIIEIKINEGELEDVRLITDGHDHCEVWGCSANPLDTNTIVSVGDDKDLFVWDLTTKLPKFCVHLPNKARTVDFHPSEGLIAVGLGGRDGKSTKPEADDGGFVVVNTHTLVFHHQKLKMSNEWISAIKWSPCGKYLAVGSHDNNIYMYDPQNKYKLLYKFTKGTSFVLQCDFSIDSKLLRVCYGDYQLLYINVPTGEHFLDATEISKRQFHTNNSIIGWGVQGIWADTNDKTDINACCTNPDETLLIAVDDNNTVRLYRYPCTKQTAQFKRFYGHSSHIPYCEFSFDGTGVVTCGGNDHTVIYWELV